MEVIGKKAKSAVVSAFISGVIAAAAGGMFLYILLTFFAPSFGNMAYMMAIVPGIFVVFGLVSLVRGVLVMRMPADLVMMDDYSVKFGSPAVEIKLEDIEAVVGQNTVFTNTDNRGFTSTSIARYGTIVIRTKNGQRHIQKYVNHIQEVAQIINNRLAKK